MEPLILLGALAAAHFIADYPLQPQYMVDEKVGPPGFRRNLALAGHSVIAGFCAAIALALVGLPDWLLVVGFAWTGATHAGADWEKAGGLIGLAHDQSIHAFTLIALWFVGWVLL